MAGELGTGGGIERRVRKGLEREGDVVGRDRLSVVPAGLRAQVEAPAERVDSFPALGQTGAIGRGIQGRGAGSKVCQPLVDLIADVPADGLESTSGGTRLEGSPAAATTTVPQSEQSPPRSEQPESRTSAEATRLEPVRTGRADLPESGQAAAEMRLTERMKA